MADEEHKDLFLRMRGTEEKLVDHHGRIRRVETLALLHDDVLRGEKGSPGVVARVSALETDTMKLVSTLNEDLAERRRTRLEREKEERQWKRTHEALKRKAIYAAIGSIAAIALMWVITKAYQISLIAEASK